MEDIFEENKINIPLFPEFPEDDRHVEKLGSGFYHNVVFKNGKIIGIECDDGFKVEIPQEYLDSRNKDFLEYIDTVEAQVNDRVIAYKEKVIIQHGAWSREHGADN